MTRHRLLPALLAAAALTLSACSSTSGTATAADSSSSSSRSSSAQPTETADASETADAGTSDTAAGSTTVTADGTLDSQSAAWFGTFCDGVAPIVSGVTGAMSGIMAGTATDAAAVKKAQAALVDAFTKAGSAMTATGEKLSSMPAPGVENGEQIATAATAAFAKAGPALKKISDNLSAATATTVEELVAAMGQATVDLQDAIGGASMDGFDLSPALQAQVAKIPACAPLMSLSADLGESGTDAPTS
jgi:hypothetical protein